MQLRGDELTMVASTGDGPGRRFRCPLAETRRLLAREPMREAGLEAAIAQIEDQIMPLVRALPAHADLRVSGSELERVLALLPESGGDAVPMASVEALFNRLADYAGGVPFSWPYSTSPMQVALGLLSLREVMHHGGFRHVSTSGDGADAAARNARNRGRPR